MEIRKRPMQTAKFVVLFLIWSAKTKSSVRGKQDKKIVVVKPYVRRDGTKVGGHRRSTPN